MKQQRGTDFTLSGSGSVYLLTPRTPAARKWQKRHLPPDALTLGQGIAIEWRFVENICNGIVNDGLSVAVLES